jgi:hypothetical protein
MGQQFRWIVLMAVTTCWPLLTLAQGDRSIPNSSFSSGLNLQGGVFNRDAFVLPDYGPKALRNAAEIYNILATRSNWQGTFRYSQPGVKSEGTPVNLALTEKVLIGQSILFRGRIAWGTTGADVFGSINGATGQVEFFERNPSGEAAEQLNVDGRYIGFLRETTQVTFGSAAKQLPSRETNRPELLVYWVPDRLTVPTGELVLSAVGPVPASPQVPPRPSLRSGSGTLR